ncbi:hypothetical protein AY599_13615 [Leptolyngbya valderiana BDU 20041]|nr:hypothetical protein AY599_13615 [Leptolyngbya valderiana BDU 20041]
MQLSTQEAIAGSVALSRCVAAGISFTTARNRAIARRERMPLKKLEMLRIERLLYGSIGLDREQIPVFFIFYESVF